MKSLQNLELKDSRMMSDQQSEFVLGACKSLLFLLTPSLREISLTTLCVPVLLRQKTLTEHVHCEFLALFSKGISDFSAWKSHPL